MNVRYYNVHNMNNNDREDSLTLEILETIENHSDVTQRHLADNLGVALGLTNSYLKRCVRKGFVKIKQVPANRYLYYLTPKGFAEKSRLTANYLSRSLDFYRRAGDSLSLTYRECREKKWTRILLYGISELAEIASIRVHEHNLHVVGIMDPDTNLTQFLGYHVCKKLEDAAEYDGILLTALNDAVGKYRDLAEAVGQEKILVPSVLGINRKGTGK